ncbi:bifunctional DNA-formamidopyrimidine glycosylase/DNA-(apurinic or apyrimidinic site) lyase [Methyloterricola oryzae]|uniref:bifunctional DNA-formamidopyrimidine glycosylase/DNA-(apurinic or apyrimidinic site) lyase n=1 Tax=Methyloterricola oryzae TaxID=1495050 RepID=UPI0005EB93D5|nr:bifunctional DNA-formamidopyrimidine glycosylase/DNA-(apurinic or apyrimidinic site) lyase [Methyloterricola oryzae]
MPELPEVETTRRGIEPHVAGRIIQRVEVRDGRLRWPVPPDLSAKLEGRPIGGVGRRGKYLLFDAGAGTLLAHLGMSGSLRITDPAVPPRKHDHVDFLLEGGACLRYHDPRRFGCLLWVEGDAAAHPLLAELGVEPFSPEFGGAYLHRRARGRAAAVKAFIMDSHLVVGVGNIYASEALFMAGIHPGREAGSISARRYGRLAQAIVEVLQAAIAQGGTTLRDFVNEAGRPGYFQQTLNVYGREGEPCKACGTTIRSERIGQRASCYCPRCQR